MTHIPPVRRTPQYLTKARNGVALEDESGSKKQWLDKYEKRKTNFIQMRGGDRVGIGVVALRGIGGGQVDWDEAAGMGGDELVQWRAGEAGGIAEESGPGAVVDGTGLSVLPRDGSGVE
jgi:hypothetical protein